jgi:D-alanyl-D-alanine carboxypeptidase
MRGSWRLEGRATNDVTARRPARPLFLVVISSVAVVLALLVVPALSSARSSTALASGTDALPAELQRVLDNVVAAGGPGVVALINDGRARDEHDLAHDGGRGDDEGVQIASSGVADLSTHRPIGPEDRFRVASVTKPFVATVILQLVAEGKLSLQDSVERWLPGMLPYGDRITVRQLLSHTSGVPDYVLSPVAELYHGDRLRSWRPQELVALVAASPPDFPAGSAWSYSNTNYVLAGLIVERVTGHRLGRELQRRIFGPLRLRDTSFPTEVPFLVGPHARGYSLQLDDQLNPIEGSLFDITVYNPSLAWGAGNIVSDVDDLARFFRALLGGRLLPAQLLGEMKTPVEIAPGIGYGLGLFVVDSPCGPLYGHSGGIPGYSNVVFNSADGRRQIALMLNADAAPAAVSEPMDLAISEAIREAFAGDPCAAAPSAGSALRGSHVWPTLREIDLGGPDRPGRQRRGRGSNAGTLQSDLPPSAAGAAG